MTKFEIANTVYYTGDSETHYTCYDCEVYASKESLDSSDGYMVQLTEGTLGFVVSMSELGMVISLFCGQYIFVPAEHMEEFEHARICRYV